MEYASLILQRNMVGIYISIICHLKTGEVNLPCCTRVAQQMISLLLKAGILVIDQYSGGCRSFCSFNFLVSTKFDASTEQIADWLPCMFYQYG